MRKWIYLNNRGQFYMEIVLVYFDVPLLFVCRDEKGKKYLVECVDEEADVYLISPITDKLLLKLLKKEKTMEECLKQNKQHKIIKVWYSAEKNTFEECVCNSSELNSDEFPDKGAYLEYHSEEVGRYQKELETDAGGHKVINIVTVETEISEGGILSKLLNDAKCLGNPIVKKQEYSTRGLRKGGKYGKYKIARA